MKRYTALIALSLASALSLAACGEKSDATGSASSHAAVSQETMSSTIKASETESPKNQAGSDGHGEAKKNAGAASVAASVKTYVSGNVSVEYPEISNLAASGGDSSGLQGRINKLLYDYALKVIKAYGVNESTDSLAIKCKVVSADRRRITAVYSGTYSMPGSAHPSNIFYTNTINTATGEVMGLTDYADPYTLAGYVLSNDCRFVNADPELLKELMKAKNDLSVEDYADLFSHGDFPYQAPKDSDEEPNDANFPQVFSFETEGTIYVSIPVPHALGDYALIAYTPESK